jgi:nicotinamide riboside kinase
MRVALVGAPGSGKSTVAAETMAELREQGYPVEFVSEFAREFICANGGIDNEYQQVFMASEQRRREETMALKSNLIVISDSSYLMNHVYASMLASRNKALRTKGSGSLMLEILYKEFLKSLNDYDVIAFAMRPTLKASKSRHNDGVRIHNEDQSDEIQSYLENFLYMHGGPDIVLRGARSVRAKTLVDYIKAKYLSRNTGEETIECFR